MTTEQMLNSPREIKINQKIKVQIESLAPAWVTLILKKLGDYRAKKDAPFMQELINNAVKGKKANISEVLESIYKERGNIELGIEGDEIESEELEIIRLMTIPNHIWKERKGNFDSYEFPYSIDDMRESFTELQLSEIWDEWWRRNPRFARKKKMMNPSLMAESAQ